MIFMPMAISFVGASVIWKLIYDTREAGQTQIGILNAIWLQFEGGAGSVLILRVLPVLILLAFAAAVAFVIWGQVKAMSEGGLVARGLRAVGVVIGLWLVYLGVTGSVGAATAQLPYGEP